MQQYGNYQILYSPSDLVTFLGCHHASSLDADFLIKCDTPSDLGDFSYEVLDTKLARTAEPKHIMQLCVYSELLTDLQGLRTADMHLFPGDHEKHNFRVADFFYYYTRAKGRFETYLQNLPADSYPEPCSPGAHWGQHLHINKDQWGRSLPIFSNIIAILLWLGFLVLSFKMQMAMFVATFVVLLIIDHRLFQMDVITRHYFQTRFFVSAIIIISGTVS